MFKLHPQLKQDLNFISESKLLQLTMLPDSDLPWCVLIPKVNNISELHDLKPDALALVTKNIIHISQEMKSLFKAKKMNIGSLGNMIPQLHIHIICRYENDPCWPGSAWGKKNGSDIKVIQENLEKIKTLQLIS